MYRNSSSKFLGMKIQSVSINDFKLRIMNEPLAIHLVNSFSIYSAMRDKKLRKIFLEDFLLCDGLPLSWYLKLRGGKVDQTRGIDLMRNLFDDKQLGLRHFFIGGKMESESNLGSKLIEQYPDLIISGHIIPPMDSSFDKYLFTWLQDIKKCEVDVIWVFLGTPKQDYVLHALTKESGITCIGVGGAVDMIMNEIKEAPLILRSIGLEWMYRLFQEPRRLLGRYVLSNLFFIIAICKDLSLNNRKSNL